MWCGDVTVIVDFKWFMLLLMVIWILAIALILLEIRRPS
jgi:hypothetical protein